MEGRISGDDWSESARSELLEDMAEIASMERQIHAMVARLTPGPDKQDLLEFHHTLHEKMTIMRNKLITFLKRL